MSVLFKAPMSWIYLLLIIETDFNWYTAAATAKSLQSCLTLCDTIDGSPPGSSIPGILQARILEWVAISFSKLIYYTSKKEK